MFAKINTNNIINIVRNVCRRGFNNLRSILRNTACCVNLFLGRIQYVNASYWQPWGVTGGSVSRFFKDLCDSRPAKYFVIGQNKHSYFIDITTFSVKCLCSALAPARNRLRNEGSFISKLEYSLLTSTMHRERLSGKMCTKT